MHTELVHSLWWCNGHDHVWTVYWKRWHRVFSISSFVSVFLGLSVLELGPTYVTDRQTDVGQKHRLMPVLYGGCRHV